MAEYCNNKIAHKAINDFFGRSPSDAVLNELKIDVSSITSTQEMAHDFNEYLTDIGPNPANFLDDSNTSFLEPAKSKLDHFKFVSDKESN